MNHRRLWSAIVIALATALPASRGETLYNGIELPAIWPPRDLALTPQPPEAPPYILSPPAVIPIDVGRQLFVDYFLIEKTNLRRRFHAAEYYPGSPVLRPDKEWEMHQGGRGEALAFSDGIWYDFRDHLYKAWYRSGQATLYATSGDGVHWVKPALDVQPGTNVVLVHAPEFRDSSTVWLDSEEKDPGRRFKMVFWRRMSDRNQKTAARLILYFSADGIHWGNEVTQSLLKPGDRSTVFWNPFRKVWVASLRGSSGGTVIAPGYTVAHEKQRMAYYFENSDLAGALHWKEGEPVPWVRADRLDHTRVDLGVRPELYNLDATPYESLMLGLFTIWRGQPEERNKPNEVSVGFSRDGFYWDRSFRQALIPVSEDTSVWNYSNVQSVGGCCLVVGDRLYFYMSGRSSGRSSHSGNLPGADTTGLATLRRDGFISMDAGHSGGTLTTRPVRFRGKYLFVNVDSSEGELGVEVLDQGGRALAPFTLENCQPLRVDNTLQAVTWKGAGDLGALSGKAVRFRFHLRDGSLYSFWVSPDRSGASYGYVAAGGPGFNGPIDTVGSETYDHGWVKTEP